MLDLWTGNTETRDPITGPCVSGLPQSKTDGISSWFLQRKPSNDFLALLKAPL